jgi:hypothetical protein
LQAGMMKEEQKGLLISNEIYQLFLEIEPKTRLWILDTLIPSYICTTCGEYLTDCEHEND